MDEQIINECVEKLESVYSNMQYKVNFGAATKQSWKNFVEKSLKRDKDLYIPENVLKIIEQLAVNNNIDNALNVYDSMTGLDTDSYDKITEIVQEYFPVLGQQNRELLGKTYNEFCVRANSKARYERNHFLNKKTQIISPSKAAKNALKSGITIEKIIEANNIEEKEQNLGKYDEGVIIND